MEIYAIVYLGSALLALVITPLVILIARHLEALDHSDVRKVHSRPIPRVGGTAIFASVMFVIVPLLFLQNFIGETVRDILLKLIVMFSGATLIFIIGLIDDVKGLPARVKFFAEIVAALAVCAVGARIQTVTIADRLTLNFGWFSWPLTILWITGITNAVNLSDGLDGLAAGISAVACAVIAIFAIYSGQIVMAVIMLALLGSLTGFLFYNFNPAKVFMGDSGSLFIGYTISTSSVMCSAKSPTLVGLALPMLALGIPIFDTLFAMTRRFLERRSIFSPDRMHFHHRLLDMGLAQRQVVIIAYVVTLLAAGLGMFMMVTRDVGSLFVFGCILLLLLLLFQLTTTIRFKEAFAALQRKYAIAHQVKLETERFEKAQLYFNQARTFEQWWSAVCEAAQRMDFAWVLLKTKDEDGTERTEVWRPANAPPPNASDVVIMNIPVLNLAAPMEFEIAILLNGSLESASHRATLFSRLIEEHNVISG